MRENLDLVPECVEECDVVLATLGVDRAVLDVRVAVVHTEIVCLGERPGGGIRAGVVEEGVVGLGFGE